MRRLLPLLPLALLPACNLTGDAEWSGAHASVYAAGFFSGLEGTAQTESTAGGKPVKGDFDLSRGGLGDSQFNGNFGTRLGIAPFELAVSTFDYTDSGTGRFNGSFLGTSFKGRVRSEADVRNLKATLGLDLLATEDFRLAVLAGVDYLDLRLDLTDINLGVASEEIDEALPIPVIGLRGDVGLTEDLRAGGEIVGLSVDVDDLSATFIDWEIGLTWQPVPSVDVFAGYRSLDIAFDGTTGGDQVDVDVDLSGPFLGVGVTF